MSDVSFNEPEYGQRVERRQTSYLEGIMYRLGFATTPRGAQTALLISAIVIGALAVATYLVFSPSSGDELAPVLPTNS